MIKSSQYFNNRQFAQAAANLSALFQPPSGADAAGWAAANAKREEAARLAQYYDYMTGPDVDRARADYMGIGAGVVRPDQSFYAVDQGNATDRYGFDTQAATSRSNNAADNARALQTNAADNRRQAITSLYGALNPGQVAPPVPDDLMGALGLPGIEQRIGAPALLNSDQWQAGEFADLRKEGRISDDDMLSALFGSETPVKAIDPRTNQPAFMSPGAAVRQGAQPYEAATAEKIDNYLAVGPNGEEVRFPGYVGPDGRIVDANTRHAVPNVIRKEGTGGGMSFEVDGQGGVRFTTGGTGNTVSQQTALQGQRDAAARSARELQTLFDNITAADVGVAGNFNDFLTNYGAQVWPEVARGDVTAMRTQMQAATMALARSLSGDNRISDSDRRMAQDIMAGTGLGESLPGARAKIAALTVLHAYREKFAGTLAAGGDPLPSIDRSVVGQLVDEGTISPALANEYVSTMLSEARGRGSLFPGVGQPTSGAAPTPPPGSQAGNETDPAPAGVDPADWEFMTPEQRALFK